MSFKEVFNGDFREVSKRFSEDSKCLMEISQDLQKDLKESQGVEAI